MISHLLNGKGNGALLVRELVEEPMEPQSARVASEVRIREYRPGDRATIRRLCCETGFLGHPVDPIFHDRELFADLFTNPYLNEEPEWALVAEAEDGRLVGYLLGSVRKHFDLVQMRSGFQTASKMFFRLVTGRYARHPRSRQFVKWLFATGFSEQPKHPPDAAHLHLDLEQSFRGRGIARRLWEIYEERLRAVGVTHCYGAFFSHPKRRPELVYARYGFRDFDRRKTTLFQPEISDTVEVVCVHKEL
jgi:GNAT superfamily N-acetyltransferase